MKKVRVSVDRWNFETSDGNYITPIGGNILNDLHPGQGTLFQNFDASDVDKRFGIMAEQGLNCVRQAIGINEVFDPKIGLKADGEPNALTSVYADLVEKLNSKKQQRARSTTTLSYSLLGLYTCRSYQDQMWDEVHEVVSSGDVPDIKFI